MMHLAVAASYPYRGHPKGRIDMHSLIDAAFSRSRVVLLILFVLLAAGITAYNVIPKEAEPDVTIPIVYVSITHEGISPEDAERLLVQPMERELQSLEGVREMSAVASEGFASITLEYDAGFDSNKAMQDVREQVDLARAELPADTDEPNVNEVNVAMFPVLSVALSGPVSERALVTIARDLQDRLEGLSQVLEVDIGGDREEMMEVLIDPTDLETYNLSFAEVSSLVRNNNQLIAAGALDSGAGRMLLKVPGVIANLEDVMTMPLKVVDDTVVTFQDIATVRRAFKDPDGFARIGGEPALVLEVTKRVGGNIIEAIESVRAVIEEQQQLWPEAIEVTYLLDKSDDVSSILGELQNNIFTAILLVMVVIIAALGVRPGILVGMAIPGSFLAAILVIYIIGYTMNIVVLFSLILVVGMLVDGAIVTIELSQRYLAQGMSPREAYAQGAKRMSWPIIASTATTMTVFVPLLFWPGVVGEFMKYLPATVLITLLASLFMALVFVPVLGSVMGGKNNAGKISEPVPPTESHLRAAGYTAAYLRLLDSLLHHPGKVVVAAVILLIASYALYGKLGSGVEFFPSVDPDFAEVQVRARGDLSVYERDSLMQEVETRLLAMDHVRALYTRTMGTADGGSAEDLIGTVQVEFVDWQARPASATLIREIRNRVADVPGVRIQVQEEDTGPGGAAKPVEIQLAAADPTLLPLAVERVLALMESTGGFIDVDDSRPLPGIEWQMQVDRQEASRYGVDITMLGSAVQMLTNGVLLAEYQPDDADDQLDIRLRFREEARHLGQLQQLGVPVEEGIIPVSQFLKLGPAPKVGNIARTDGRRTLTIEANVGEGYLVDERVRSLQARLPEADLPAGVDVVFKGESEDQQEAAGFLLTAFLVAVALMTGVLLTQFNSIYQTALILTAIVFSTAGVLIGLIILGNPFGVVMGGVGIIALAGIVVNNNIILIDTYNEMRRDWHMPVREAILATCAQRLRPVLLTSITTILGLLPMVYGVSINIIGREVLIGAPSGQMWVQLSSSIAGGLLFATLLTLLLTPCMLMLGERKARKTATEEGEAATQPA